METISHQNGTEHQRNEQQEWIELYAHALLDACMGKNFMTVAINYVLTMVLYVIKECCV